MEMLRHHLSRDIVDFTDSDQGLEDYDHEYESEDNDGGNEVEEEPEELDADFDLEASRAHLDNKLKSRFEAIFEKYGQDFTGIGDEIDLRTGEIVVNNGHLLDMMDERDAGAPQDGRSILTAFTIEPDESDVSEEDDDENDEADEEDDLAINYGRHKASSGYVENIEIKNETHIDLTTPPRRVQQNHQYRELSVISDEDGHSGSGISRPEPPLSVEPNSVPTNLPSEQEIVAQFGPEMGRQIFKYISREVKVEDEDDSAIDPAWRTPGLPSATPGRRPILASVLMQPDEDRSPSPETSVWAPYLPRGRPRADGADKDAIFRGQRTCFARGTRSARLKKSQRFPAGKSTARTIPPRTVITKDFVGSNDGEEAGFTFTSDEGNITRASLEPILHDDVPPSHDRNVGQHHRRRHSIDNFATRNHGHGTPSKSSQLYTKDGMAMSSPNVGLFRWNTSPSPERTRRVKTVTDVLKQRGNLFTPDEDQQMLDHVAKLKLRGGSMWGKPNWLPLAEANPRHTWGSWEYRYRTKYFSRNAEPAMHALEARDLDVSEDIASHSECAANAESTMHALQARSLNAPEDIASNGQCAANSSGQHEEPARRRARPRSLIKHFDRDHTSSIRRRSNRVFTDEDDKIIFEYIERWQKDGQPLFSQANWAQIAAKYPQHNMWSWMNRFRNRFYDIKDPKTKNDQAAESTVEKSEIGLTNSSSKHRHPVYRDPTISDKALDLFSQSLNSLQPALSSARTPRRRTARRKEPGQVSWDEAVETIESADPILYAGILADARFQKETLNNSIPHSDGQSLESAQSSDLGSPDFDDLGTDTDAEDDNDSIDDEICCICDDFSHGNMIACDNDHCTRGWFHFDCVGIQVAPEGSWYCPWCTRIIERRSGQQDLSAIDNAAAMRKMVDNVPQPSRRLDRIVPNSQSSATALLSSPARPWGIPTVGTPAHVHSNIIRNTFDLAYGFSDDEDDRCPSMRQPRTPPREEDDLAMLSPISYSSSTATTPRIEAFAINNKEDEIMLCADPVSPGCKLLQDEYPDEAHRRMAMNQDSLCPSGTSIQLSTLVSRAMNWDRVRPGDVHGTISNAGNVPTPSHILLESFQGPHNGPSPNADLPACHLPPFTMQAENQRLPNIPVIGHVHSTNVGSNSMPFESFFGTSSNPCAGPARVTKDREQASAPLISCNIDLSKGAHAEPTSTSGVALGTAQPNANSEDKTPLVIHPPAQTMEQLDPQLTDQDSKQATVINTNMPVIEVEANPVSTVATTSAEQSQQSNKSILLARNRSESAGELEVDELSIESPDHSHALLSSRSDNLKSTLNPAMRAERRLTPLHTSKRPTRITPRSGSKTEIRSEVSISKPAATTPKPRLTGNTLTASNHSTSRISRPSSLRASLSLLHDDEHEIAAWLRDENRAPAASDSSPALSIYSRKRKENQLAGLSNAAAGKRAKVFATTVGVDAGGDATHKAVSGPVGEGKGLKDRTFAFSPRGSRIIGV